MSVAMSRAAFEARVKKQDETRQAVLAALKNEMMTRERVKNLEHVLGVCLKSEVIRTGGLINRVECIEEIARRPLLGRLKWLLVGK